jgi:hypothetical protein
VICVESCVFKFDRTLSPGQLTLQALVPVAQGASQSFVPAVGATVKLQGSSIQLTADRDGRVVFVNLAAGTYALSVVDNTNGKFLGAAFVSGIQIALGDAVDLGAIRLNATGGVHGFVYLTANPELPQNEVPVPGAALQAIDTNDQPLAGIPVTQSDGTGAFHIPYLPAGTVRIRGVFPWTSGTLFEVLQATSAPVTILAQQDEMEDLVLTNAQPAPAATLQLQATAPLGISPPQVVTVGLVPNLGAPLQPATGLPARDALVSAIPPGVYTIIVAASGFENLYLPDELLLGDVNLGVVVLAPLSSANQCSVDTSVCDPNAMCAPADAGIICTCGAEFIGSGFFCLSCADPSANCQSCQDPAELCADADANCGSITAMNKCGQPETVPDCGSCAPGSVCGAQDQNQCGCAKNTDWCAVLHAECGAVSGTDACGKPYSSPDGGCGTCPVDMDAGIVTACGIAGPNRCSTVGLAVNATATVSLFNHASADAADGGLIASARAAISVFNKVDLGNAGVLLADGGVSGGGTLKTTTTTCSALNAVEPSEVAGAGFSIAMTTVSTLNGIDPSQKPPPLAVTLPVSVDNGAQ